MATSGTRPDRRYSLRNSSTPSCSAQDALKLGFGGLRTNGNCAWVREHQRADFLDYETLVQKTVRGHRMS
jgi:hypothetical protein